MKIRLTGIVLLVSEGSQRGSSLEEILEWEVTELPLQPPHDCVDDIATAVNKRNRVTKYIDIICFFKVNPICK